MTSHSAHNHTNDDHQTHGIAFVDANSIHDKFLSMLAILALAALVILGVYWQSLPLPAVQTEEESN